MLNLFFTIVFLAEIILAHWLISKIIKLDNYVKALNFLVVDRQSELKITLKSARCSVNKAMLMFANIVTFINAKQSQCKTLFSENLLSVIGCSVLKIPFKQMFTVLDTVLTLKRLLRF